MPISPKLEIELIAQLLNVLTHDLRNPLSAVHSNLTYIASMVGSEQSDVGDALDDALVSTDGLSHLIDNVEVLAHSLREGRKLEVGPVACRPLLEQAVQRCLGLAKSHEVTLDAEPAGALKHATVKTQREMLGRSLECLIRNAIQHSPAGSSVKLDAKLDDNRLNVTIHDEGPALSDEFRELAFSAEGQLVAKGQLGGRYSRGLGLFCASVCAEEAAAKIVTLPANAPYQNVFCLQAELAYSR